MSDRPGAWLGWPDGAQWRYAAGLALWGGLWFVVVFGGTNWITAQRTTRVAVHSAAELRLPFVPEAIIGYVSLHLLFALAPFVLRTRPELRRLAVQCNVAILVAGIGFLLVPAQLAYPPSNDFGMLPALFHFADRWNLTYNLFPSLHVAFAMIVAAALAGRAGRGGAILLWTWAAAIAVSTLLTHQHHVADVVGGVVLGALVIRCV